MNLSSFILSQDKIFFLDSDRIIRLTVYAVLNLDFVKLFAFFASEKGRFTLCHNFCFDLKYFSKNRNKKICSCGVKHF